MLDKERKIDHIRGDGNCLFRALSKELLGHEKFHYIIRRLIVQFMSCNLNRFQQYCDQEIETYISKMASLGTWGTSTELYAIATLLQLDVYVFSPQESECRWVCYHPQPASRFTFQETQGVKKFPTTYHIEIVNSFRSHFDRLSPRDLTLTSMETVPTLDNSTSNSREEAILIES